MAQETNELKLCVLFLLLDVQFTNPCPVILYLKVTYFPRVPEFAC